jgi:hypothetical protein
VSNISAQELQNFDRRASQITAEGSSELTTRRLRRSQTDDVFDSRSGNLICLMAINYMPWINRVELEWGVHCVGCQKFHRS